MSNGDSSDIYLAIDREPPEGTPMQAPAPIEEPPGGFLEQNPEAVLRAMQEDKELAEMDSQVRNLVDDKGNPALSFDELAAWNTMDPFEKRNAYRSGRYEIFDPSISPTDQAFTPGRGKIHSGLEIEGEGKIVAGTPLQAAQPFRGLDKQSQIRQARLQYGDNAIVLNSKGEEQIDEKFVENVTAMRQAYRKPTTFKSKPLEYDEQGYPGVITAGDMLKDSANWHLDRLNRKDLIQQRVLEDQQAVLQQLKKEAESEVERGKALALEEWATRVQESRRFEPLVAETIAQSAPNYTGRISVDALFPHLQQHIQSGDEQAAAQAMRDWMYLTEALPRGAPTEYKEMEEEVEWSLNDRDFDQNVVNMRVVAAMIAEERVTADYMALGVKERPRRMGRENRERYNEWRSERLKAYEKEAYDELTAIRRRADGTHFALFKPDGKPLSSIILELEQGDSFWGSAVDAWWNGSGTNKTSKLYLEGDTHLVEYEGLLDWSWRGLAGLSMGAGGAISEEKAIADIYHGVGFDEYADEVGYAAVDLVLAGLRKSGMTDMEADEFPAAIQFMGTSYVVFSTISTPDVITAGTAGLGAIGRTGGIAAGLSAGKMEAIASAAEEVTGLAKAVNVAKASARGFLNGMAGTKEVALESAKGRYLFAEADNFMYRLSAERLAQLQSATNNIVKYDNEAKEVQKMLNRVEKVLGKSEADMIRAQYSKAIASNAQVSVATGKNIARAIQAEARLAEGIKPITWESADRAAQAAAQAAGTKAPITGGMTRGGLQAAPGKPGTAGKQVRLGTPSRRAPTNVQEDAINLVRQAVETGKPVWKTLEGTINPVTNKAWKKSEIRAIAEVELRAVEAGHIALASNLAELKARRNILRSFAGKQKGSAAEMRTAALNARRHLDRLTKARKNLHNLQSKTAKSSVKDSNDFIAAQKLIEKNRRQVDAALEHLGRVSGNAAHTFLDNRITRAERLFNKTGSHLETMAKGIAKDLGAKKGAKAGLHNAKQHEKHVKIAQRQAYNTYMVPGYRILGNIIREQGKSHQALASAWADPNWSRLPTFKQAMNQLETAGFLGRRIGKGGRFTTIAGIGKAADEVIKDTNALAAKLMDMFDLAVLERVATRGTPDSDMLLGVIRSSSTRPLPAMTKGGLARNIETLTSEAHSIMVADRGGAVAAATLLDVGDLARHNPAMVKGLFHRLGARFMRIGSIKSTVAAFTEPYLYKVGFGNKEITDIMKGIEYVRKYHSDRLTFIATSVKLGKRFDRLAAFVSDKVETGDSVFNRGITFLKRIGDSSDEVMKAQADEMFAALGRAFFAKGQGYNAKMFPNSASDITQAQFIVSEVKKAIMGDKVKKWEDLIDVVQKATNHPNIAKGSAIGAYAAAIAKGEKPTVAAMHNALYAQTILAQTLLTAGALESGLSRVASITSHLSDDAIKGLAMLQQGEAAALPGTFKEIAEVATKLGIPPRLSKVWTDAGNKTGLAISLVKKDGGYTFLNQRVVEQTIATLKNTIKNTEQYYKVVDKTLPKMLLEDISGIWTNVLRMMTTGAFHIGYYFNMTYGNFTQVFAEAGLVPALQVVGGATVGAAVPALTKLPVIGPKLASKYDKFVAELVLPHPSLAMVDARTAALMNPNMLKGDKILTLPSGEKMTVGAFRMELVEAGAFTSLSGSIAPASIRASNKMGFLQKALSEIPGVKPPNWLKPTRVLTKPLEMSAHMFSHLEILQRVTLYNYLRFNKGYSKGRSAQIMQNSLYDWAFATTDAETAAVKYLFMFYNFHKLSFMRGLNHLFQPALAGAGRGGRSTVGGRGFVNTILRTSPLHPDAFAMARINMYDRAHRTFIEDPGLEEAGVERPGWARLSSRTFAGGGQLTQAQRLALMETTGRDATAFVESLPAPTPQSVIESLYNISALGLRASMDDDFTAGDFFSEGVAKEVAARSNPIAKSLIESYFLETSAENIMDDDRRVPLYSPAHRLVQQHLEAAFDWWPKAEMYREDRPYAMRVSPGTKSILSLLLLPVARKLDPIIESEALDMNTKEAADYWFRQNAGVYKRHFVNPELEKGYREARFDNEVQDYLERVTGTMPGGQIAGEGALRGPSLESYEFRMQQRQQDLESRIPIGMPREDRRKTTTAEEARKAAFINKLVTGE